MAAQRFQVPAGERAVNALDEIYRTIIYAMRPKAIPQCIFVSADLYVRGYDELKETDLAKVRGVLAADIPFPNYLVAGIPVIPF